MSSIVNAIKAEKRAGRRCMSHWFDLIFCPIISRNKICISYVAHWIDSRPVTTVYRTFGYYDIKSRVLGFGYVAIRTRYPANAACWHYVLPPRCTDKFWIYFFKLTSIQNCVRSGMQRLYCVLYMIWRYLESRQEESSVLSMPPILKRGVLRKYRLPPFFPIITWHHLCSK